MKITDIKSFILGVENKNLFIVKVETDRGIHGIGQGGTTTRERAMKGAIGHFREFLIGRDPRRVESLHQELYRRQYYEGGTVITASASAIDIALWDILGKHLEVPVWQLLGGASRQQVECFVDSDAAQEKTWADQAQQLVQQGWRTIRFVPETGEQDFDPQGDSVFEPWESLLWCAQQLQEVRRRTGPGVNLAVDYHHRLNVAEAATFCERVEDVGLMFLEEPIRSENPAAYASLRAMTNIPFAIGKEFSGIYPFVPFFREGLCNYARLDVCNVGGLTAARKVAALAETHYTDVMPHTPQGTVCVAASLHLCASLPNVAPMEYNFHSQQGPEDLFPKQPKLEGNHFPLAPDPGLGIEFNESAAEDYPPVQCEAPRFHRRDGSYTNY